MIARTWHGRTRSSDAEVYRNYVISTGIRELTSIRGNLRTQIWQRTEGNITHIWVVSWWKDDESIRTFAGENIEIPRYYDEDKKYLLELEPLVQHAEVWDFRPVE